MHLNDRFADDTCYTCGAVIPVEHEMHNDWHHAQEMDRELLHNWVMREFFSKDCTVCGKKRGECIAEVYDAGNFQVPRFNTPYGPSHTVPNLMPIQLNWGVVLPPDTSQRLRYIDNAAPIA